MIIIFAVFFSVLDHSAEEKGGKRLPFIDERWWLRGGKWPRERVEMRKKIRGVGGDGDKGIDCGGDENRGGDGEKSRDGGKVGGTR